MKQTLCRLSCLGLLLWSVSSYADDDRRYLNMAAPEAYMQECAGCHVGFSPGMLSAKSWKRMMSDLKRHYGAEVVLSPEKARQIEDWLVNYAARGRRASSMPPENRVTQTRWFVKEHRRVAPPVWRLESVKSPANCQACHRFAEQGHYDDDELIVPQGVTPAQMRAFLD